MKLNYEASIGPIELDDGLLAGHQEELGNLGHAEPVRLVYAAAHLVMRDEYACVQHSLEHPVAPKELQPFIDWDASLALRRRLDGLGFGIAEAMDTAQRFQIGWPNAKRLIELCGNANLSHGFLAGAGVDHLEQISTEEELVEGVCHQARLIQAAGGSVILLPLAWLVQQGYDEEGYIRVYRRIVEQLEGPLFIHWLGAMFHPGLVGYFPGDSFLSIMRAHVQKLRGAKLSLLDAELERRLRRDLLSREQVMLTGDDFHFGELMLGGPIQGEVLISGRRVPLGDFSHGLLGIFDAIAEPASCALGFLAHGNEVKFKELMDPCQALGQHLFQEPTEHYKAGLACLAWLNGMQSNPMLVQHQERARDLAHFEEAARLASLAGVLVDARGAAERLHSLRSGLSLF